MKPRMYWDPRIDQPNNVSMFVNCGKCLEELPGDESAESWGRYTVGVWADGSIQVWCVRHDCNVNIFSATKPEGIDYGDEEPIQSIEDMPCAVCEHEPS